MGDLVVHKEPCGEKDDRSQDHGLGSGRTHITQDRLEGRDRGREDFVDGARKARHVDSKGGVGDTFCENREHHQSWDNEGAVLHAVDGPHPGGHGRAEDDEVKGGRDHRRGDALAQGPEEAGHLEEVDGADTVKIHLLPTSETKMSSRELS